MSTTVSLGDLERELEKKVVCAVYDEIYRNAMRWNKDVDLIPKVRSNGYIAETGARNIREGTTPLSAESTFEDMQRIDEEMYDGTLKFLLPLVQGQLYAP